jgi:glutamyl-tRNA reductase
MKNDQETATRVPWTVAVGGLGAVGRKVAQALDAGLPGLTLTAVSARDRTRAKAILASFQSVVPLLPLSELAAVADIVVECAPAQLFPKLPREVVSRCAAERGGGSLQVGEGGSTRAVKLDCKQEPERQASKNRR